MQINKFISIILLAALSLAAAPAPTPPTTTPAPAIQHPALFLIGDSIMNTGTGDGSRGPWGYGAELIPMFDATNIHVYNEARGGRSSRGYIEEGLWAKVLTQLQPGDFLLIQFGHNDAANSANYPDRISAPGDSDDLAPVPGPNNSTKSVHSYGYYLRQYIADAKAKGASPIVLSPTPRNQWSNGKIKRGFDGYAAWARQAATETNTPFIDLNALVADRLDALGQPAASKLFADTQHSTKPGAHLNAQTLATAIQQLPNSPLAADLAHP